MIDPFPDPVRHQSAPQRPYQCPPGTLPPQPRIWPIAVVIFVLFPGVVLVSGVCAVIALVALEGTEVLQGNGATEALQEIALEPVGFFVVLLPPQLCYLLIALVLAALSPVPWKRRLGLVAPRVSPRTLVLLLPATLLIHFHAYLTMRVFDEPSEQLEVLLEIFTQSGPWAFLIFVVGYSVFPGVAEELVFRGYIQTRFLERLHPFWAITFASLVFAAVHIDLQHVLSVLPLAFWLGIVAWRTGSVIPAMLCHAVNNGVLIVLLRYSAEEWTAFDTGFLIVSALCFLAVVPALWRGPLAPPDERR